MAASCFPSPSTLPITIDPSLKPFTFHSSLRFPSSFCSLTSTTSQFSHDSFAFGHGSTPARVSRISSVVQEEPVTAMESEESTVEDNDEGLSEDIKMGFRPCELYVCNLPRSCDVSRLLELFRPYGTVQSVEVSRNIETGRSRGCGYVTMSSIPEAKAAMAALDGSEVGEREMCVRFSADTVSRRGKPAALNMAPKVNLIFESPHKVYVGNLAWSVKPENLREHFSQFGNIVSTRVLYDRKAGRNRVYGFLSFSTPQELEAAMSANGMEFYGRRLLVREAIKKSKP